MKFLFAIISALFTAHLLAAQHIAVKSFRVLENDLDARVNFPRKDQNGDVCALIKAVTTETGFDWDGDQLGIVKTLQKKGEIWIYVPFGAKRITISHAALGVLRNYAYPLNIEKAAVYEMALTTGKVVTVVQEEKIKTARPSGPTWIGYVFSSKNRQGRSLEVADFVKDGRAFIEPSLLPEGYYWTAFSVAVPDGTFAASPNLKLEARIKNPALDKRNNGVCYVELSQNNKLKIGIGFCSCGGQGATWMKCGRTHRVHLPELCANLNSYITLGFEMKDGTMSALIDGAIVKTITYKGSLTGEFSRAGIFFRGGGSVDWLRIYQDGALRLGEEFNADGETAAGLSD